MLCFHPIEINVKEKINFAVYKNKWIQVPCGRCYACRRRRQQDWSIRLQHECQHVVSSGGSAYFITLTYASEHLRHMIDKDSGEVFSTPSLDTKDPGRFMRKFRKRYGEKVRYFACGEYGDQFDRPHVHIMLFLPKKETSESLRPFVESSWPFGFVKGIYPFSVKLSEYISKYSMKQFGDSYEDKVPPYARMSLKPAIGSSYIRDDSVRRYHRDQSSFVAFDSTGTPFALPKYYRDRLFSREELDVHNNSVFLMRSTLDEVACRKDPLHLLKRYQANVRFEENFKFKFQIDNERSVSSSHV